MTVNIEDKDKAGMQMALDAGYHAYHANGITAIETKTRNRNEARYIASQFGKVLYIYE